MDHKPEDYLDDMQKDVDRLKIIANRFSKIGSKPKLKTHNLIQIVLSNVQYFKRRTAKQIQIDFKSKYSEAIVQTEKDLLSWVIENLIKNAVDALPGKGLVEISVTKQKKHWVIDVKDNGKGMTKKFKEVFLTGIYHQKERVGSWFIFV